MAIHETNVYQRDSQMNTTEKDLNDIKHMLELKLDSINEKINHPWFKNKKSQILVASGKLAHWKGFDDLIKAANILNKKKFN